MKSSTKFLIIFILFAAFSAFITFYPNFITLLPFKIPYVAGKVESMLQWASYIVTIQAFIIGVVLKIRRQ